MNKCKDYRKIGEFQNANNDKYKMEINMFNIKSRHAFTLIELLVVISIIAVLMGIMMPALHKARLQAQKTVCISNMKQQANAQFAFAASNNGKFPKHGDILPGYLLSPDRRMGHPYDSQVYDSLKDYFADGEVFVCPATKVFARINPSWLGYYESASWRQPVQLSGWWYGGWNADFTGTGGDPKRQVRQIAYNWYANFKPSGQSAKFEQESDRWPENTSQCTSMKGFISHNIIRTTAGFYDYSHGGKGTLVRSLEETKSSDNPVCYADGHIKMVKKSSFRKITSYKNEAGQELDVYY